MDDDKFHTTKKNQLRLPPSPLANSGCDSLQTCTPLLLKWWFERDTNFSPPIHFHAEVDI